MDKSLLMTLKEPLDKIVSLIRDCDAILWAGSGLSVYAGYPSGAELSRIILNSAKTPEDTEFLQIHENSLKDISDEYTKLYSRNELIDILRASFNAEPTTEPIIHKCIARIPQITTIITTNYDELFEMVYVDRNTVNVGTSFKKSVRGMVDIYKIHGDNSDPNSIIITDKDYSQFYNKLNTILWSKIKALLAEKSVIFVGYSLEDKNIQDIFEKIIHELNSIDKELFIVTPMMHEHKLRYLNTICKTIHIPLTGEVFFNYIEGEIQKNIILDTVNKKISIDEAYKMCREHGITPTIVSEPYGNTTRPIVEKVTLTPETFLQQRCIPFSRGTNFSSNPETYEAFKDFLDNGDCNELIIPAEDAVQYQNINGIHIPENRKINGKFPTVVKITKVEFIKKFSLVFDKDNALNCSVLIKSCGGNIRSKTTIEMLCMDIQMLRDSENTKFEFSYRYPHSADDAISDLKRLKLWCNSTDLIFINENYKEEFILKGLSEKEKMSELISLFDERHELYKKIKVIENALSDKFIIEKEFTADEKRDIRRASASVAPHTINFTNMLEVNVGKITLEQLDLYANPQNETTLESTSSDVLPEDYIQLFNKDIILGIRKIQIIKPYVKNIDEVKKAIEDGESVIIKCGSKNGKAILEYLPLPIDNK